MAEIRALQVWRWPRLAAIESLRAWLLVITTIGLSWALLLGSVSLGLRTNSTRVLGPYSGSAALDYSSRPRSVFAPLTSAFIGRILPGAASPVPTSGSARGAHTPEASRTSRLILEHPFDNDDFQNAREVSSIPLTAKTNTTGATRQDGEPTDCALVGGTVWYRYRPSADEVLSLTTVGTNHSTSLGVFAGTGLGSLRNIGCDTSESGDSWVTFAGRGGTTYFIQVTGPLNGGGNLILSADLTAPGSLTSVTHDGVSGNGFSSRPSISGDGRYVLFLSQATNLVGDDDNDYPDVFLRDRLNRTTTRVSLSGSGGQAIAGAFNGMRSMSEDGRVVAFESFASLVPEDTNQLEDIYVRDLITGTTQRASVPTSGKQAAPYGRAYINCCVPPAPSASVSADGRFVAFHSWYYDLVPNDTNYCPQFGEKNGYQISTSRQGRGCPDIFVRDLLTKTTTLVSPAFTGTRSGNDASYVPMISSNGQFVAFYSEATNLVSNDTNALGDIFVRDRSNNRTTRVSVSSSGEEAIGGNSIRQSTMWEAVGWRSSISADGRYVAFTSSAPNLVANDSNFRNDVFVHDRLTSTTDRVSVASSGMEGNGDSNYPDLSPDGRYVTFSSHAENLVAQDTNLVQDVFVHDRATRTTRRLSVSESGEQGNDASYFPALSADGRFVTFTSWASNFVPWDRNGQSDIFVVPLRVYR